MISLDLLLYSLVMAGVYLLVISLVLDFVERRMKLTSTLPSHLVESGGVGWTLFNFAMEALFYVVIPTFIYSFFYVVIPFTGVKAGLSAAVFAFVVGATPVVMGLSVRVKLPTAYLMWMLLSVLVKLGGCLGIIGYLYGL